MARKFKLAALGGTFDHFHAGHQQLITQALSVADQVIIGIVKDATLSQKHFLYSLQSYPQRQKSVYQFLATKGYISRFQIVPLSDIYGPTISNKNIDLLIATRMTHPGVVKVNTKRRQLNLPPLPIKLINLVMDQTGQAISSTLIRAGSINRQGFNYLSLFDQTLKLKSMYRKQLQQPQGNIITIKQVPDLIAAAKFPVILVGDLVAHRFYQHGLSFHCAIIDGLINRKPVTIPAHHYGVGQVFTTSNKASTINTSAVKVLVQALTTSQSLVKVNGEEDLLAFGATLLAPLESLVLYGQPHKGLVAIKVTESEKARQVRLLNQAFVTG